MKNNGITLIALVITIVVLLILAAVSINAILGDNGIVTRAQDSKSKSIIGMEKEKLTNAVAEVKMSELDGSLKISKLEALNSIISKDNAYATLSQDESEYIVVFSDSNNKYKVSTANSRITEDGTGDAPPTITAEMVGFTPSNSNWKAKDGSNITNVKQALDYLYDL